MNKLHMALGIAVLAIVSGCSTFKASDETVTYNVKNPDIVTKHSVDVWRGSVLTKSDAEGVYVKYGDVEVGVNKYSQSGDSQMMETIGNAIVNGILAYGTYGAAPAVKAAVKGTLKDGIKEAATNCADGSCAAVPASPLCAPVDPNCKP